MVRTSLLFIFYLTACGPDHGKQTSPFTDADASAIRTVLAEQEVAWDRGDLPAFMEGYADTVCFIGARGMTCGRDAVLQNYVERYPDREAMGDLDFGISELVPAGDRHAWMTGTWRLVRTADTLSGGFTLLWVEGEEGWRIARDHSY